MSTLEFENWDGVTAPAIPTGWNIQSGSGIVTTTTGATPLSSPNMITLPGNSLGTDFAAIWSTADGVSGNVTVQGTGLFVGQLGACSFSVFARASSATAPFTATCYEAQFAGDSGSAGLLNFNKWLGGTLTNLSNVAINAVSLNTWYMVVMTLNATTHNISVQRQSDGFWLNFEGNFTATETSAIAESDSAVTGSGFSGWAAIAGSTSPVFGDDWTLIALSAPEIPPNKPIVVAFPYQYYPAYLE